MLGMLSEHLPLERIDPRRRLLLRVAPDAPVLSVIVTAYDATARPIQVSDLVLPGQRHELRDAYPFT